MNILTIAPAFMAGTALLAAIYHLLIYSRLKLLRFNLTFALLCISVAIYDFFTAGAYLSTSVTEGMWWSRAQIATLHTCGIALLWFLVDYTNHKPRKMLYGFAITLLILAILSALNPFNILQDPSRPIIKNIQLMPGLEINYYEVQSGILSVIQGWLTILLFCYIAIIILKYYRTGHNKEAKPLFMVITLLFLGVFNDAAVEIGLIQTLYLLEYTYIVMIIYMTYVISKNVVDAAVLEQALRESETRYRHIVEGMNDGLILVDKTGKILYANEPLCKMTRYQSRDLIDHDLSEFLDAANLAIMDKEVEIQRKGKCVPFELEWKGPENSKVHTLISAAFLFDKDENFKESIVVVTDITERNRAEETLKKLYEETRRISEIKSALITFVSHELKTPIVPILGWSDLIQTAMAKGLDLNKVVEKDGVESVVRSANRLSKIINNFLDLDRLERGTFALNKEQWSVTILLTNVLKEIAELARAKNITIKNTCEEVSLLVDGFRVEHVFINILTNAIKYSPPNTQVEIYSEKGESSYSLLFRDEGYGFTPEELRDVWQPFSTVFLRKKYPTIQGTGIGLRLARGIIEQHGGHIEIASPGPNHGSTVKIILPLGK